MNLSDFYYDLPEELIAQLPIEKRDESRLLVLDKKTGKIKCFDIELFHNYDRNDLEKLVHK